jgi:hypothetical protein
VWRMRPDAEHGFLGDVLGVGGIAENAACKPDHGRQMAAGELAERRLIAARDLGHKRFVSARFVSGVVAVSHGVVNAAIRKVRP